MAAAVGRICGARLLKNYGLVAPQVCQLSTSAKSWTKNKKIWLSTLGVMGGGVGTLLFALEQSVQASGSEAHPHHQAWPHDGWFNSYDHASIRRGYEVYKQVCKACHSLQYIAFRNLVNVTHTETEAKAEAAEVMVKDGPNEEGEYFERPGKLSDYLPSPYPNENAARAANNGAYPPDLSLIASARKGGEDYIFALLTGYMDPPAGISLRDGQNYNPYFAGGAISMAQVLFDEVMVKDGPNEEGEYFERPGKLSDYLPSPYPNENAARAANNGAYPPDLSLIASARKGGEDYIFALLTGYMDPPAGISLRDGQNYNPYFAGGAISMAQVLFDEAAEYTDGTPPTASQLAKDVSAFLRWCSEPELDDRRLMTIKALGIFSMLAAVVYYYKRHKWSSLKSRKLAYKPVSKK